MHKFNICLQNSDKQNLFFSHFAENLFYPVFTRSIYNMVVEHGTAGALRGITAFDEDEQICARNKAYQCSCGKILCLLVDADDSTERFRVNPLTCDIAYDVRDIYFKKKIVITLAAVNVHLNETADHEEDHTGYTQVHLYVGGWDVKGPSEIHLTKLHPKYDVIPWTNTIDVIQFMKRQRRKKRAVVRLINRNYLV